MDIITCAHICYTHKFIIEIFFSEGKTTCANAYDIVFLMLTDLVYANQKKAFHILHKKSKHIYLYDN